MQDLVYEGRRLPFASLQMEGDHHWDSSKIHCTMEKQLNVVRKQNGGAIQHISANRYDWISISQVRRVEMIGSFVLFGHHIAYFTVKTKAYNVIISHSVQLWLLFKNIVSFYLNLLLSNTTSLQSLGRFLWATQYIM